ELLEQSALRFHRELNVASDVERRIELRLLWQKADARAFTRPCLALEVVIDAGHDAEQRRLPRSVRAEHADLGAVVEGQPDAAQNLPRRRDDLAQVFHDIDER